MNKLSQKYTFTVALIISAFIFLILLTARFLTQLIDSATAGILIYIFFSILASTIITLGISIFTPILKDAMVTLRRLIRYDSLSHPLIIRLSYEAPGTYHHSINVSNLSQKAAKSIGADSLLVRVASYYHDIGKLENPLFYIENQSGDEIPSDESVDSIKKNAEIIISHVKNGVKIAKEYELPEEIIDIIAQHHGTTRALYFYELAKEKKIKIKKTDFKYSGPTPQTKESAIIMLADTVEAATRAIPHLTNEKIVEIVGNAIDDKGSELQFKNCNFSKNDLNTIKESLIASIKAIYHQRIQYTKSE